MIFAIIMTAFLFLSFLSINLTEMRMVPVGLRLMPLIEAALLWVFVLSRGNKGWLWILFLIQYYIIFVIIVAMAGAGLAGAILDREHNIGPVTLGNPRGEKTIAAIYHPGGTDYTGKFLRAMGERLAGTEYRLIMHSARRGLQIDLVGAEAVILASPVYAGQIRPPVKRFIERGLAGKRCVLILTGGGAAMPEKEFAQVVPLIEKKGGEVIAKGKFAQSKDESKLREEAAAFTGRMLEELGKE